MDVYEYETSRRVKTAAMWSQLTPKVKKGKATQKILGSHKKARHSHSLKAGTLSCTVSSSNCIPTAALNFIQSITMPLTHTPPTKTHQKVRNPFETTLMDRRHLPLIASPLFRPPTQMSSTKFEWTIDEISSVKATQLKPLETQFQDSPNPDLEAKANPMFRRLRNYRSLLSELNGNTQISKPSLRTCEHSYQTELTLPASLPPALELALKLYFQPHLGGAEMEWERRL
uniref:Protein aurora borealis n=1 Tax=Glossina brevipalpis TaxID=37001 RepID=A0A1A9WX67_9MUSC